MPKRGSPRQTLFIQEYLVDMNGTQAAIRAGYKGKNHDAIANQLLRIPWVVSEINAAMKKREQRTQITADRVLRKLESLAFASLGDFINIKENGDIELDLSRATPDQIAALGDIEITTDKDGNQTVRAHLAGRDKALMRLCDHLGIVRRLEIKGKISLADLVAEEPDDGHGDQGSAPED